MKCTDLERLPETAREHAQHPRNLGPLSNADGHARITGPCGDTMEFWVAVADGAITKAAFTTDGCGPSLACGSITTVLAKGRPVEVAARLRQEDIAAALGGLPEEHWHCALLAVNTLNAACQGSLRRQQEPRKAPRDSQATCNTCGEQDCSAAERKKDESDEEFKDRRQLQSRLCRIRHKVVVLSSPGAVNRAVALLMAGKRVGLLDVDIHGPSVPTMLGLEREQLQGSADGLIPADVDGLKVISMGFFLNDPDDAVIWRGPLKMAVIKQFLKDVDWGDLDYLIIDSPPGTGDEPLSVCQLIGKLDGAIVVTTPQKVAAVDVRKSITFCRQLHVPVLGVVENMSGFACPKCGEVTQVFCSGAGREIARDMLVPFLGSIPIDPKVAEACDNGQAFVHHYASTPTAKALLAIVRPLLALDDKKTQTDNERKDES
jgi:Mrp family chromosome partitioning ATPase